MRTKTTRLRAALATAIAILSGSVLSFGSTPAAVAHDSPAMLSAPTSLRLDLGSTAKDGAVVLTWDKVPGAAYYQIFRYNGPGNASVNELTYIGATEDASTSFINDMANEGHFQYAVMAVNATGAAGYPSDWASTTVDLPDNGAGTILPDVVAPNAPADFMGSGQAHRQAGQVPLTWSKESSQDLWRYLVYRQDGTAAPRVVAYVAADTTHFTDEVTLPNTYTFFVVAQDTSGNMSLASDNATVMIETTAQASSMSSPRKGAMTSPAGDGNEGPAAGVSTRPGVTNAPAAAKHTVSHVSVTTSVHYYEKGALSPTII